MESPNFTICHICKAETDYPSHDGFLHGELKNGEIVGFCRRHRDSEVGAKAIKRYENKIMENLRSFFE